MGAEPRRRPPPGVPATPPTTRPSTLYLALVLGTITAFGPLSIDMYLPSLPTMARDFGVAQGAAQATVSSFLAGLAIGQGFWGPISDRFGRRLPMMAGIAIFILASIGCYFAQTMEALIAFRFVQALGSCAGMVLARAVVRDLYDPQGAARMLSLMMLVMGVAPILAPFLGGQLLLHFDWRAIFAVLVGFGMLCMALVVFALPETRPASAGRARSVATAFLGYVALARDRGFWCFALSGGIAQASLFAYIAASPVLFIEVYGIPPEYFGFAFGLNAIGLIAATQVNRRLLLRLPSAVVLRWGVVANAAISVLLLLVALSGVGGDSLLGLLAVGIPLFGCIATLGFTQPNALAGAMAAHPERAGAAASLYGVLQFVVGASASAAVAVLNDHTPVPMALVICACALLALAAQLRLGRR